MRRCARIKLLENQGFHSTNTECQLRGNSNEQKTNTPFSCWERKKVSKVGELCHLLGSSEYGRNNKAGEGILKEEHVENVGLGESGESSMRKCHGSKDLRGERAGIWDKVPEELEEGVSWLEWERDTVCSGAEVRGPVVQEFVSRDEGFGSSSGELWAEEREVCLEVKWKGRQIQGEQLKATTKIQVTNNDDGSEHSGMGMPLLAAHTRLLII